MTFIEIIFASANVGVLAYTAHWLVKYTNATQDILQETAESNNLSREQLQTSKEQLKYAQQALDLEKKKASGAALPFFERTSNSQSGGQLEYEFRNTGSKVHSLKAEILKESDSAFSARITMGPPAGNLCPQYKLQVNGPFDEQHSTYIVFVFTNMLGEEGRFYYKAVKGGDLYPADQDGSLL
jgi:hypothetical protein